MELASRIGAVGARALERLCPVATDVLPVGAAARERQEDHGARRGSPHESPPRAIAP
jgi:hypothetical protein